MINSLGDYQAVCLGENVQVKLPSGKYKIDGVEHTATGYVGLSVVINKESKIQKVKDLGLELTHYENANGDKLSPPEYQDLRKDAYGEWDDDLDEYIYESLEHEFECRKKQEVIATYKPQHRNLGCELEDIEYTIIGSLEDTGSPYIETAIKYGSVKWGNYSSGIYRCDLSKAAYDRYCDLENRYGKTFKFHNDNNRHYLRFAKVNGTYVFGDVSPFKEKSFVYVTTLKEANSKIFEAQRSVDKAILPIVSPKTIDTKFISELLCTVNRMQDSCLGLSLKQSSKTSKSTLLGYLSTMESKLKAIIEDSLEG